ncbi:MAG: S1 RNA-binding domain-containing protein [Lachnospiraceae bacterium]|nr:S1 RNA-binding domain-containing protein [Lachnospiraceae bacterium]
MIELGKYQRLTITRRVPFGVYLADHMPRRGERLSAEEEVLLPGKQVPEGLDVADSLEVFVYKDSEDRPIATVQKPKLALGETAMLKVVSTSKIGAFLDWGLEKDLFLPFKEQTKKLHDGDHVLVALYTDKSNRLAATMKVYHYLATADDIEKDTIVQGTVYEISDNFGAFVAVEDKFSGLLSKAEPIRDLKVGDTVEARVTGVKEDGKLDLSLRQKAYLQMDADSEVLLKLLEENGGKLPIGDKSSAEEIRALVNMSKNEFKRAVGHLYKEGLVTPGATETKRK